MRYYLQFPDGCVKHFENGSTVLAEQMAELLGKKISITREGEGTSTKYIINEATEAWPE